MAFLKTYKTGSETISGILRRFALLRNLSSAISVGPGGKNSSILTVISRHRAYLANVPFDIAQLIIQKTRERPKTRDIMVSKLRLTYKYLTYKYLIAYSDVVH